MKSILKKYIKIIVLFLLKRKSNLAFKQIKSLSRNIPYRIFHIMSSEIYKNNDFYGNAYNIKQYLKLDPSQSIKASIEHGLYLNSYLLDDINNNFPTIFTFSKYRYNYLKKNVNKRIFMIGPYIRYAKHILNEEDIEMQKKKLGKNLLVFPSHSIRGLDVDFNIDDFCKVIKKIGKDFDSIRICLYWRDVERGLDVYYRKYGFKCITSGHIFDPFFLQRLKSILEIATVTMSNSVGTHIGYCIAMNKPHYIAESKLIYNEKSKMTTHVAENSNDYVKIKESFSKLQFYISENQYNVVNYYWGLDQFKTRKQLKELIDLAEYGYAKLKRKEA